MVNDTRAFAAAVHDAVESLGWSHDTLMTEINPADPASLREHARCLRSRLAELDADHRDRTAALRDDLRKVANLLTRHAATRLPAGLIRHADGTFDFQGETP